MGSFRAKRAHTAAQQLPNKRLKTSPNEDGVPASEFDMLQMLPPELLLLVVANLSPRQCQPLRLTCKALRDVVNTSVADTLTVTNDIAQYLLLDQTKHWLSGTHVLSNGWVARLLAKFPGIKQLDVKCTQGVLTIFARHMVRDCLGSVPPGGVPLSRIFDLADNVKTNSRRHSAVLLCELIKFKVAQSLTSKPAGYDAMRQDVKQYVRADQLLAEHRMELQARVIELVEKVLTLKGHVEARAHEHYKYARDTLDDSLLQLVSCLQPRHSKYAYQLLAKAADPAKAARGWRWLFYFLARQKQAEAAIEAYKVVDKQALASLSPTCLSELFRSLIDNEITTQPEPKLRAITSESGSWTKFLYRGNFTLTSTQNREGALEKVAADLIGKDYLDTAVNVMNRFETEATAMDIWVQLLGALGIVPGGEMPLVARDLHRTVADQVAKAAALALQVLPARRVACHVPLVEVLVAEGHLEEAFHLVNNYPEQGALDKHLLRALSNTFSLADCPPEQLSAATCDMLLDLLRNRLRDVATRSELTTVLVAAYAARKELHKAVELASSLDAAAAAAMEADGGAAGGPAVEPVPAAAAAGAGAGAPAQGAAGDAGAMDGGADAASVGTVAGQRIAEMWRGVATAAVQQGDAGVLLTALPRVSTAWLLSVADEDWGPEVAHVLSGSDAGTIDARNSGRAMLRATSAEPGPSRGAAAGAAGAANAATIAGAAAEGAGAGEATAASAGAGPSGSGGGGALTAATTPHAGPCTVWQRVCGVLMRSSRRGDLESALLQLLGERRRTMGGHTDQRALLESTARAMLLNGYPHEALTLARSLGGRYSSAPGSGCATAELDSTHASSGSSVRPCWAMLNVVLEGLMAAGHVEIVLQELLAAGAAQSKAAAAALVGTSSVPAGATGQSTAAITGNPGAGLVLPAAAGRLRQSLLTDVLSTLTEAGRPTEAVHLLRVLRGGENDGPMVPPQVSIPAPAATGGAGGGAAARPSAGRVARPGRAAAAAAKRNRLANNGSSSALPQAATGAGDEGVAADPAPGAADASAMVVDVPSTGAQVSGGGQEQQQPQGLPQPQYNRLLMEGSGDEEAGQTAGAGSVGVGAGAGRPSTGPGSSGCPRAASLEAALAALVKALQKWANAGGSGSATISGSSGGSAGGAVGGSSGGTDLLNDWLEVCKAWPPGPGRDSQLDALARRAMDKGRDLEVALQAGWLLGEASPQELRFAYTHRDLAQKCIGQGMLEAAQACLLRISKQHSDAGDATARELMRAMARAGDKPGAIQLAQHWLTSEDQRTDFIKTLRSIRSAGAGGAGGGSRAGSSSRGSSRE